MLFMGLCTPYKTSAAIFKTIGFHIMSMPCILDGNKECLTYDIAKLGAENFKQIAANAGSTTKVGKAFTQMADLCIAANAEIEKMDDSAQISRRTCQLVKELAKAIKDNGANKCSLVQMVSGAPNLLSILSPQSLKEILSPRNLKWFFGLSNILNIAGSLKNLGPNVKSLLRDVKGTLKGLNLNILNM